MTSKIKITFLGTGDAIPSARRNHTAILLDYEGESILIDCGEGTQRQFRKAGLNPCKITKILITHWHGDHILGIPGLIQTLAFSGYSKSIQIYGPKGTKKYMDEMMRTFKFENLGYKIEVKEVFGKFFENDDFFLEAESMKHGAPANAYAFIIKDKIRIDKKKLEKAKIPAGPLLKNLKQGKNVLYEGKKLLAKNLTYLEKGKKISIILDTEFNEKMEPFVKNSDLFICESSFGSELKEKAKEYKHLSVDQVANTAKRAKVKRLILTHISSRYENNLKKILDEAKKIFKESYLVKDLDVIEVQ